MEFLGRLILTALDVYIYVIMASVILSWLIVFEVINVRNQQAANLIRLLEKATEPVYRPLRKFIPPLGGIDVTPVVVIFGIYLLQHIVARVFFPYY